ncbi:MAG: hypothetical protein RI601_00855 [Desulfurivibrionaceae bacterium]|nr:hypothetical protein [Desulfurivibrionaceae bacterium]
MKIAILIISLFSMLIFSGVALAGGKVVSGEEYRSTWISFYKEFRVMHSDGTTYSGFGANNPKAHRWIKKVRQYSQTTRPNHTKWGFFNLPNGDFVTFGDLATIVPGILNSDPRTDLILTKYELAMICVENPDICKKYEIE